MPPGIVAAIRIGLAGLAALAGAFTVGGQDLSDSVRQQIQALQQEKESRTPAQQKMDSQLIYAAKKVAFGIASQAAPQLEPDVKLAEDGTVLVDITATVSDELLKAIQTAGGRIVNSFPASEAIRAALPLAGIEALAGRADVRFIERAAEAMHSAGSVDGEGDTTHRAAAARAAFGVTGAGVNIGVISDSVDYLARSQASNDLGSVTVLTGQSGEPATGEGTAMLEIVADIAPGAGLFFATGGGGSANMSNNIVALQAAGCNIIVDDLTYYNEFPFQDDTIAKAVNLVSAAGAMYFSCARNSGNLTHNTSGTWEGDFADAGTNTIGRGGRLHSFGNSTANTASMNPRVYNRVDLFWADPLSGTANDYDFYVLDPTANTVHRAGTTSQTGTQRPYEFVTVLTNSERIIIVKYSGADRFLHLDTGRARLSIATVGSVRGHNAVGAPNAFSVAATAAATAFPDGASTAGPFPNPFTGGAANPIENFSSDGPRRIFFTPNGTPITPGNFSSTGGQVIQKPDITAADGVTSSAGLATGCPFDDPCFSPFFGTSAAAPHAAAIAALLLSSNPALTPAQIRTALISTALDIEAPGVDRDSGAGIVMPFAALKSLNPCTLTCPANIVQGNDPDQCSAVVTFPPPTTSGGCGTVTYTPPSGSVFPVGTTTVTATSASEDSCSFTVKVVDTQLPTVTCPAPITVEFQDENGAVVPCVVSASDNCPGISLRVTPPCGSLFPIGVTPVVATATDAAGNTNYCDFTVTVLGAQGVKSNVLVELIVLRDQATIQQSGSDTEWWNCTIQNMICSLQTCRWLDQRHIVCGKPGAEVFDQEKNVVVCLTNLIDWGGSGIPGPTLQNLVDRLVRADRLLAIVSIQEAVLAGVSPVIISNALVYVARGDEAAIGGQASGPDPASAIWWYKQAWALTCRVCPPVVTTLSGGKVQIQFYGVPGQKYLVQGSTDMVTWVTLNPTAPIVMGTSGCATYLDKNAARYSRQFYRILPTS